MNIEVVNKVYETFFLNFWVFVQMYETKAQEVCFKYKYKCIRGTIWKNVNVNELVRFLVHYNCKLFKVQDCFHKIFIPACVNSSLKEFYFD